ncbi:MAG: fumarylacetoacetate hydrolase family protein [Tidjanibacter sp.]|nr:fumarylacetoacetate hydrolase family protein [Tidjanibacter sp.]MBR3853100.1 fumarylacetoacetate hydrolase family protein [Tidjanibacter sp.]MBR7129714.1 fumarylacetoacetate hydrolase family protein [Tidjanibacter sp.]
MKIICIGRNYADHIKEFDSGEPSAEPIYFMKPDTALLRNNDAFYIPKFSTQVDYETELVVKINRVGKYIEERFAHRYYDEVGLGVDFTARDVQRRAMAEGLPWEQAKGFDHSAAISPRFLSLSEMGKRVEDLRFEMTINDELRQVGEPRKMIHSVERIISYVSRFMTLKMGDLIYTGTPAGVGPVHKGDVLRASLEGVELLNFDIR